VRGEEGAIPPQKIRAQKKSRKKNVRNKLIEKKIYPEVEQNFKSVIQINLKY
jgi:hypothetical protein